MPTPHAALVAVAAGLAGIDPVSEEAVEAFYTDTLPRYGADKRELIMDWLAATVTVPTPEEIAQLVRAIHPEATLRTELETQSSTAGIHHSLGPSHRSGGTRRILQGVVVSDRGEKTVVVKVERRFTHPVMKKTVRRTTTYRAHDAANAARLGQTVRIEKIAPNSRTWELVDEGSEAAPNTHS